MRQRPLRFTLRALLVLVAVLAIPLAAWVNEAHRQRRAVDVIQRLGGRVAYGHQIDSKRRPVNAKPPGPDWLRRILWDEYFVTVVGVTLYGDQAVDVNLELVRQLKDLQLLAAWASQTDPSRKVLLGPTPGAGITDNGLARLTVLTDLRHISLADNEITDAGLEHLKSFPKLVSLQTGYGRNSRVTKKGIQELRK
jgi:hypothetical protein